MAKGRLYIVATPIGNLEDITIRALETLKAVDIIACENRARHLKLLNRYEIKKRIIEYSPANEKNSAAGIVKLINEGNDIALVSDAGTPSISDPGRILVETAVKAGIEIFPIPGVSALTAILSVSGFGANRIFFLGFMPKKEGKITKELSLVKDIDGTIVFFISQYNIKKTLSLVNNIYPNSEIIIGREMTKLNEEFLRGKPRELMDLDFPEKGEFTVAINNLSFQKRKDTSKSKKESSQKS
jgi:16S rRNA (cytidine1402-2'-O)-methyltransferase